mgnify:CR=1 FL=1
MTDAPLHDPIDALLDVLDLTWEGSTTIRAAAPEGLAVDLGASEGDIFLGQSQRQAHGRVFGGQVLAQAVVAAGRTVATVEDGTDTTPQERHIHSLHAYFLRPGDRYDLVTLEATRPAATTRPIARVAPRRSPG